MQGRKNRPSTQYQKRFQRRINHGRVESKLLRISAALLLTVAPMLNYDDLECLSQRWEDSWLSREVVEASKKYEQLAIALLFFMDQIGTRSVALLQRSIHLFSTITWTLTLDRRPIKLSQKGLVKFHEIPAGGEVRSVQLLDNIYRRVVQFAKDDQSTRHALFALPLDDRYEFQKFDYHWLGHDCHELSMVNSILGLSRKMLYFQYTITMAAKMQILPCQSDFLKEIDESPQLLREQDLQKPLVRTVATATMEAYRLATRLYACGRLYRLSSSNTIIKQDVKLLVGHLESLPTEGDGYSGIHPAFCFIIACMCIEEVEDFAKLHGIFERIGLANKSNVLDLCTLLTWIWNWKISSRVLGEDWWEDQANMLNLKMEGKPICVT